MNGCPTQDEVMAVSLFKLELQKGDIMADIGCGTGKVALAAARTAGKVHAIDLRAEAIAYAKAEAARTGVRNIEFFEGTATAFLEGFEGLDCAFVGGSKDIEQVLDLLSAKVRRSIVVNAVMTKTLCAAVRSMRRHHIFKEAVQLNVARSYGISDGWMFKPIDPVFIVVGEVGGC